VVRLVKGGFDVAVSKLASDSRFNLVSSPSLRVSSGESARVVVGQDVPVLGAMTVPVNGAPVQSVNYQSSGVMLDITPVALEEMVKLTLRQEISDFAQTSTGVNSSPTLLKRAVSSVVSLQSGEVVFIGGLDETNQTGSRSGLSWLPGWMWSKDSVQKKTELVVMLQVDVLR
jgi:type II secretory pathway component GspD/PulD (secretin)